MRQYMEVSSRNLKIQSMKDWLIREFPNSDVDRNAIRDDGLYATFYTHGLDDDDVYEIIIYDHEKAERFSNEWDWWLLSRWYEYHLGYSIDPRKFNEMKDWCNSCIKPADWKDMNSHLAFRYMEDLQKFEFVFGKEDETV